jgi:hypothetical protein
LKIEHHDVCVDVERGAALERLRAAVGDPLEQVAPGTPRRPSRLVQLMSIFSALAFLNPLRLSRSVSPSCAGAKGSEIQGSEGGSGRPGLTSHGKPPDGEDGI